MPSKPSSAPRASVSGANMNPRGRGEHDARDVVRGLLRSHRQVVRVVRRLRREQLVDGRPAVARRGQRGERRGLVVGVHRFGFRRLGVDPHRGDQHELVGVGRSRSRRCAARRSRPPRRRPARHPTSACACRSLAIVALFTNNVIGFTGRFGAAMTTNGACPALGDASAVAHAVPTGPSRGPSTVFTCAASTPLAGEPLADPHRRHATRP